MTEEKKTKMSSVKKIITAGILGAAAGAIAGVLLSPKSGKLIRKDLKKVYLKISQEVVRDAKKMKNLTQDGYEELVDKISDVYKKAKKVKDEDLEEIVKDLKKRWLEIVKKLKKE